MVVVLSLHIIVLKPVRTEGFTHASSVMPFVRSRELASLILTKSFVPSNKMAAPYLPEADQPGPLVNIPVLLFPELSLAVVPVFSLNPNAATKLLFKTIKIRKAFYLNNN